MAQWICNHVVYLPVNGSMSQKDLKEVANRSVSIATRYNMYLNQLEDQVLRDIRPKRIDCDEGTLTKL